MWGPFPVLNTLLKKADEARRMKVRAWSNRVEEDIRHNMDYMYNLMCNNSGKKVILLH